VVALQMGQVVEAERLAAEVLKANRNDIGAASILARALMIQNRNEEAIAPLSGPPAASRTPAWKPCSARRSAAPVAAARRSMCCGEPRRDGRRTCPHFRRWQGNCTRTAASTTRLP